MPSDTSTSVWSGSFRVFGVDVKCHVLSDGRHIIEEESVRALFDPPGDSSFDNSDEHNIEELMKWIMRR